MSFFGLTTFADKIKMGNKEIERDDILLVKIDGTLKFIANKQGVIFEIQKTKKTKSFYITIVNPEKYNSKTNVLKIF